MKRLLCVLILSVITLVTAAQTDSTKAVAKDTTKNDAAVNYAIVLNEQEYAALINLVKIADEKPSVINAWIAFINSRTQQLQPPAKETPKTPAPKKQ